MQGFTDIAFLTPLQPLEVICHPSFKIQDTQNNHLGGFKNYQDLGIIL